MARFWQDGKWITPKTWFEVEYSSWQEEPYTDSSWPTLEQATARLTFLQPDNGSKSKYVIKEMPSGVYL